MKVRAWQVGGLVIALSGCAQFKTSGPEQASLETAAKTAEQDYVNCILDASDRYQQTGEDAELIVQVSKKACSDARSAYADAEATFLKSKYISTEPILKRELAATDERATTLVNERVLERKAAAPPVASPAALPATASAQPGGDKYLDCMRTEGQRYASVDEPAAVVAEVAHSRCSATLTDPTSAAVLERQGRALVMGIVLDRKVSE